MEQGFSYFRNGRTNLRCFFGILMGLSLFVANVYSGPGVTELDESSWDKLLTGEWMVEFYAPWCPACKSLETTWSQFGTWSSNENVRTAKIDVTKSPGLSGRFLVTALPTIFHVKNGEFRQYRGSRDLNSFQTFVEENRWKNIEPVSAWKRPDSISMSVVSMFFKLSHYLKELNTKLLTEYGLPTWGSYAIFAIATIFLGTLLGLLFVCIIDFLFPQKAGSRQGFVEKQREKLDDDEEVRDQDLVDENEDNSDREKYSGTDSDDEEPAQEEEEEVVEKQDTPKASPKAEVRKRKARKAEQS